MTATRDESLWSYRRVPTGRPTGRPPTPYGGPDGEKRCTRCGLFKPLSEFHKHGGRHPACRDCRTKSTNAWYEANPRAAARKNLRQRAHLLGLNRDEVSDYF